MDVKLGYKQTDVGIVPDDWEVTTIGDLAPLQRGFDLPTSQLEEGSYPVVYSNGVVNYHKVPMVKGPGVVTGRSGTLGKVHFVEVDYWPHNTSLWVTKFNNNDPRFIYYLYGFVGFERFASGSGVPTLNRNDAHSFHVATPSTRSEQNVIAEALSDADAYIESLELLIAKKRLIKQGTMQELFDREDGRITKELGEICTISKERFDPSLSVTEKKCIELEHISSGTGRLLGYFTTQGLRSQKTVFRQGDVLFGKLRPYLRKFWFASFDGVCSTELWVMKPNPGIVSGWLYWLIQTDRVLSEANKSTGTKMPRAEWATVKKTVILVPSKVSEQVAVAEILSNMDAEIASLETKLYKTRQIKLGMMQELLTGRIRLI